MYQKLAFLKTGLETTLKKLTDISRDLKRAGQNQLAFDLHAEMLFVGRMIAVIDVLLLEENVRLPLDEFLEP